MDRNERTQALRNIGRRRGVIQIVPPRGSVRQAYLRKEDSDDNELVTRPLASPTGPGGAVGAVWGRGVIQILPPPGSVRPAFLRKEGSDRNEPVTPPPGSPTGPGGPAGF